ncbi:MAG: alpha/beta hydrolase, partial [Anaerolineae bacterium]|nr:alpha/beta hydrolase [Anaerolineae bacterium]
MKKLLKFTLLVIAAVLVAGAIAVFAIMRLQGIAVVTYPMSQREQVRETPTDYGLPYEEVMVTTADGLSLVGWFIPSENGATVIAQHGYHGNRDNLLHDASMLHRHGYAVLLSTFRAHDLSEGEIITFGAKEVQDLEAWHQYLLARPDVDPARIGILGES